MRYLSVSLLFGLITALVVQSPARATDDDPVRNGFKLSDLIARYQATKGNDANSVNTRGDVAQQIAAFETPKAIEFLGTILKEDKSAMVKVNTAMAINRLVFNKAGAKLKPLVPDLVAALKDGSADVRASVAISLGAIGPDAKTAEAALLGLLKNPSEVVDVRASAAAGLAGIKADETVVVPLLKDTLKDKSIRLRMASASALYRFDKKNAAIALPVLREGLKNNETVMEAAMIVRGFGSDAKDAIPDLIAIMKKGGISAYYAPDALGAIPEAEEALVKALKDPDKKTQEAAAAALRKAFPEAAKKAGVMK